MEISHYDVLIIGAGLSGIGMACHLAQKCPHLRVGILERRKAVGGTWDLFRYPGIRSDSDMATFGFHFRPWTEKRILADGPSIRKYVEDTAREYGVDRKIRFGLRITQADWCSQQQQWTATGIDEASGEGRRFTARFLVSATGYYDHDEGYLPDFPGREHFSGECVHPQFWPERLDYRGRRVVVIGSGATAVTLLPSLAEQAAHVTMLQRSPSYVYSLPATDGLADLLHKFLPERWVYGITRRRNIFLARSIYKLSRRFPGFMRKLLLGAAARQVGRGFDMTHLTPRYQPWDERICAVPDGDLFKVLRSGKASVVTDHIECFTGKGIRLRSGRELEADIIVTATGLKLQALGGMQLSMDGAPIATQRKMTYKAVLVQDVPNLATIFGYTNISWTLKVDLAADYVCRLLQHMEHRGAAAVIPRAAAVAAENFSVMGSLKSGYVQRSDDILPRQGRQAPWQVTHSLESDREMYSGSVEDAILEWLPAA